MKVGERGQVTIPKALRDRFGIGPDTEVEFFEENGQLALRKRSKELPLRKWKGYCADSLRRGKFSSVDDYINRARGKG
jgi:AbrB family looped-hinge helix DNA binding protein